MPAQKSQSGARLLAQKGLSIQKPLLVTLSGVESYDVSDVSPSVEQEETPQQEAAGEDRLENDNTQSANADDADEFTDSDNNYSSSDEQSQDEWSDAWTEYDSDETPSGNDSYNDSYNENVQPDPVITYNHYSVTTAIPFDTIEEESSDYAQGEYVVWIEGSEGLATVVYEERLEDGVVVSTVEIERTVDLSPVNRLVYIGTYVAPDDDYSDDGLGNDSYGSGDVVSLGFSPGL